MFLLFFVQIGAGNLFDHKVKHDFPYAYYAADSFTHQSFAQSLKDVGDWKIAPSYFYAGFDDVVGFNPPTLPYSSVQLSYFSGLEVYDTIYFLVIFLVTGTLLVMYLIIREFSRNVAILSLPFTTFLFTHNFYSGILMGQWDFYMGEFLLICLFYLFYKVNMRFYSLLIGFLLSALFMAHSIEFLYGCFFIFLFLLANFYYKKIDFKKTFKKLVIAGVLFLVLSFYFIVIVNGTWVKSPTSSLLSFDSVKDAEARGQFAIVKTTDFGFFLIFLVGGIIISLLTIRKFNYASLVALFAFLIGAGNSFGIGMRAFQFRFLWPITLCFFFGLSIFYIVKLVIPKWKLFYSILLAILLCFLIWNMNYNVMNNPGVMDPQHWQAINWIEKNTGYNERLLFFYGTTYLHAPSLYNAKRVCYLVKTNDYIDAVQKSELRRTYDSYPSNHGVGMPYRVTFFEFASHAEETNKTYNFPQHKDLCSFEYVVLDKITNQQVFSNYNLAMRSKLMGYNFTEVFSNQVVSILKNPNVGGDCIEY